MISAEIISAWVFVLLTLCIFSFLYKDNPFYKAAEHLYVGASAGYVAVISFWQQVQPNMFGRLWPSRVEVDDGNDRMNAKIRQAQLQKVPYMFVVGDREVESNSVSVRVRSGENLGTVTATDITARILEEVVSRS